jgi:hypothetical protein
VGNVELPLSLLVGVITVLGGCIGALFRLLLTERQARLAFVEQKLSETEKRESAASEREAANAQMLANLLELTQAQTRGAAGIMGRRPGSLPGTR